jgi:hypothetical protein
MFHYICELCGKAAGNLVSGPHSITKAKGAQVVSASPSPYPFKRRPPQSTAFYTSGMRTISCAVIWMGNRMSRFAKNWPR